MQVRKWRPRHVASPREDDKAKTNLQIAALRKDVQRFLPPVPQPKRAQWHGTTLVLPYPPSGNRYWRHFQGRTVRSAYAQAYISAVRAIGAAWGCQAAPPECEVSIRILFYRPALMGDTDNREKILGDALNGVLYEDDKQVADKHTTRYLDRENPRVEVTISEWESQVEPKRRRKPRA